MRIELLTRTAAETRAVGEAIAGLLEPGDVVALTGELGAGKTTFVQGVARGLEVKEQVVSPTFTLVREYRGRVHVAHVDVYRLDRLQDVVDLGLEEIGDGQAVLLVEWGDAIDVLLPAGRLEVELTTTDPTGASEERRIVVTGAGPAWQARWPRLVESVEAWGAGS
ncbi:MAG: tRNA (adenosine(37)-N6)-threonylcarbamoyltransferase complex ATPase subunit type 1 TsaE [Actinobacteria bacterium]|nr:tRNA (adenosine(37)-N6)-threonylcarbamoyltransferase complex ATPase subunit type 1 TsaE [Actinomycetota bacterium]